MVAQAMGNVKERLSGPLPLCTPLSQGIQPPPINGTKHWTAIHWSKSSIILIY